MLKEVKASKLDISFVGLATNSRGSVVISPGSGKARMPYNIIATPKVKRIHFRLSNRGLFFISCLLLLV